jgi:PAS domain S-box-containing protein
VIVLGASWVVALRYRVAAQTEELQATLESTADGIVVVDSAGKTVAWNGKFAEMWGIPDSVLKAKQYNRMDYHLRKVRDPEAFLDRAKQIYADPEMHSDDVVELRDARIFDRHSEPVHFRGRHIGRVWAFRDITSGRKLQADLIAERHLLRQLMNHLPDKIYFKDRDSHFTCVNKALMQAFGVRDPEELMGKTDFDFFTPEHAQPAWDDEQDLVHGRKTVISKEEKETWPDGCVTWALTTMAIREWERSTGAHQTIIAMTAHAMKGDEERCRTAGMDGYIPKPIESIACANASRMWSRAARTLRKPN